MVSCKICNQEFKNLKSLSTHLNIKHKLTSRDYYDVHMKKDGEGKCNVCGGLTTYRNLRVGYLINCSIKCRDKNKNIKHDYWKGRKQPDEMITKRISNTNQIQKQKVLINTMVERYGVINICKLNYIKDKISIGNKGKIAKRNNEWQQNIIESKRKNGTLNHSDKTKNKISDSLNKFFSLNLDREKYIPTSNNINHFCGWYNGLYFRSSLELSFLVQNNDCLFTSCEKNKYKIIYEKDGKQKTYYPDFTDGIFIYEIKPSNLLNYKDNQVKIKRGVEVYGEKFKVITENEVPYLKKLKIFKLIDSGIVVVSEKSLEKLKNYRY